MQQPKINICGLFNINLSSLLAVIAEIILFSIILIEVDYIVGRTEIEILVEGKDWEKYFNINLEY